MRRSADIQKKILSYNGDPIKFLDDIDEYIKDKQINSKLMTIEDFSITLNSFNNQVFISRVIDIFESCVYENDKAVEKQINEKLNLNILLSIFKAFYTSLNTLMLFKLYSFINHLRAKQIKVHTIVKYNYNTEPPRKLV
jgi:hypothetical protein